MANRDRVGRYAAEYATHEGRGEKPVVTPFESTNYERSGDDGAEANLVGTPTQAVRAGAPGRGRPQPPAGAARRGDRVPEGRRRPPGHPADAATPQHDCVRRCRPERYSPAGRRGRGRLGRGALGPSPRDAQTGG